MRKLHKPRILLIYGNPDSGKSWLANELKERFGYEVVSIDEAYINFVKEKYPRLHLEGLNLVVSQHYDMVLLATEKGAKKQWRDYVFALIKEQAKQHSLLAVEGYLLHPILDFLRAKLSKIATINVVHVDEKQYFLTFRTSIDGIHAGMMDET